MSPGRSGSPGLGFRFGLHSESRAPHAWFLVELFYLTFWPAWLLSLPTLPANELPVETAFVSVMTDALLGNPNISEITWPALVTFVSVSAVSPAQQSCSTSALWRETRLFTPTVWSVPVITEIRTSNKNHLHIMIRYDVVFNS